jgi:hypothetical protein
MYSTKKYSLISVEYTDEKSGLCFGSLIEDICCSLDDAIQAAIDTEEMTGYNMDIAVVLKDSQVNLDWMWGYNRLDNARVCSSARRIFFSDALEAVC